MRRAADTPSTVVQPKAAATSWKQRQGRRSPMRTLPRAPSRPRPPAPTPEFLGRVLPSHHGPPGNPPRRPGRRPRPIPLSKARAGCFVYFTGYEGGARGWGAVAPAHGLVDNGGPPRVFKRFAISCFYRLCYKDPNYILHKSLGSHTRVSAGPSPGTHGDPRLPTGQGRGSLQVRI